jgi:hypothetical protein
MRRMKMAMGNVEKKHIIDRKNLSGEFYFTSILQEAYSCGLLSDSEIQNIQMQCFKFLAYKSDRYNSGDSSSIRVEIAESIMKSNLYTIGLYLKSLPDVDFAVNELKSTAIPEMYDKGRKLINVKFHAAEHLYRLAQKNRIATLNQSYNETLNDIGIGTFFKLYNADFESHEAPASIDYQLCSPAADLAGVEYIKRYLESLYIENEFCRNFSEVDIHRLLLGYDENYQALLINIFEHVLIAAIGCSLSNIRALELSITKEKVQILQNEMSKYTDRLLIMIINKALEKVMEELKITDPSLAGYIKKCMPKVIENITQAVRTDNLDKVFISKVNPNLKPRIHFNSPAKMNDDDYRKLVDELLMCRYSSDKLTLIKEKIKSLDDFEEVLFDAQLSDKEIAAAFRMLKDAELAILIRRHPIKTDIQDVDITVNEQALRAHLKFYFDKLPLERQEHITEIMNQIIDE